MTFNSTSFLVFFPIVVLIFFLIPQRGKNIWLLICSYYFYMSWNPKYMFLIAISTLITWSVGLLIGKADRQASESRKNRLKKVCLAFGLTSNLAILAFFKYSSFFMRNLSSVLSRMNIEFHTPLWDILLPVGISFYTLQAIGYTIDVYRGTIKPTENLLEYALFISFFPQLVAGPIERSKNLLRQFKEPHFFDSERVIKGILLMAWGFYKKLVIADRAALLVTPIYSSFESYNSIQILMATVVFAIQIYCDFSGYSDIAIGAAQVLGFHLMDNFHSPYFAASVSEFWHRWHISLSTWLRDYLYIPLGGNRAGKWKKYRNIMITFCISGLWHGAGWGYVIWGVLNGLYQVIGDLTKPFRTQIQKLLGVNTKCWSYRFFQGIITFILIDFSWVFFRADSLSAALNMIKQTVVNFEIVPTLVNENVIATLPLEAADFVVLLLSVTVLLIVDLLKDKIHFRTVFLRQNLVFRFVVYYVIIWVIAIFGIYGPEYNASTFIYFQF